ncbi:MAG: CPBP family intramembrane glutamic endopeptidase [Bernardetiaceae bacterium]
MKYLKDRDFNAHKKRYAQLLTAKSMLKSLFFTVLGILTKILLTYAWLIGFGICSEELDTIPAIICGFILIGLFYFVHIRSALPKKWSYNRLKFIIPKHTYLLIISAILFVLGDFFWLFHIKTSQSTFTEDPLDVLVLAVVAFPLVEEFGFRLWLQSYLESKVHKVIAVLSVSSFFAFIHGADLPIPQLLSGIFYGIILITTTSVWWPFLIHVLHNVLIVFAENIPYIKTQAFILMDRQDGLNLVVAIIFWSLASIGLLVWVKLNREKLKIETL